MSLAILFHFLYAEHVSDINIFIIRSLRLFYRITTLVVLFLVRCACVVHVAGNLQHGQYRHHSNLTTPKLQHTLNQKQHDQCGNSIEQSQAPDDGYINVRNMLST